MMYSQSHNQLLTLIYNSNLNSKDMLLSTFKAQKGITAINLYNSTKSDRLVGSADTPNGTITFVTKMPFDSKKDIYVYPTDIADKDTGEITVINVLSNTVPKEATLVL